MRTMNKMMKMIRKRKNMEKVKEKDLKSSFVCCFHCPKAQVTDGSDGFENMTWENAGFEK